MKRIFEIATSFIIAIFLFITSCSNESKKTTEQISTTIASAKELIKTEDAKESSGDKMKNIVNEKISNKYYFNDENGLYTVIHFEPIKSDEGTDLPFGAMILSQMKCDFSFSYEIAENKIDTKFVKSGCGRTSSDRTFFYDQANDYIYMNMEGQKFVFKDLIQ